MATQAAAVSQTGSINGLEAKFIDVKGIRTRYYEAGSGEHMVLCHGAGWSGSSSANVWAYNIPGLAERLHVYAADKIASGMTANPRSPDEYTIGAQVQHMYDFIRTAGIERCHMVGQSRGGYLATRITLEHPELVKTLVVCDSATLAPEVGDLAQRRARLAEDASRAGQTFAQALGYNVHPRIHAETIAAQEYMDSLPKALETKARWEAGGEQLFNRTLAAQKEETLRWIREGRLQVPTLISWGKNDPSAILQQGHLLFETVCEHNPRTRMIIFNEAGHFHFREFRDEWNRYVTTFIDTFASPS